ncbi:DNA repair protein [Clostridium sp. 19966]|uniref:MutS-related protein n=1 Tax=Clostridium sp. 19966 TaxID=2768166 RepID=UPI0028DDCCAA|nr:DNA repair protein [Clostridium sp. 19966]MDT8716180.1 DNA repair protein [Clostridium sp. 19966]
MSKAKEFYVEEKNKNEELSKKIQKEISSIGYLRLLDFVVGLLVSIYIYYINMKVLSMGITVIWIGAFVYLVKAHQKAIDKKRRIDTVIEINNKGIARLEGKWKEFQDDGKEFSDAEHPFCDDLDLFGKSSLFQWINSCATYMGRLSFVQYLKKPVNDINLIKNRQQAVKELAANVRWRQKINAEALMISDKSKDPTELIKWAENQEKISEGILTKLIVVICPLITIAASFLLAFNSKFSYKYFLVIILLDAIILKIDSKNRNAILDTVMQYKKDLKLYFNMIKYVEDEEFKNDYLGKLKKGIYINDVKASKIIGELSGIVDYVSDRYNMGYIIINIIFMWDYRVISMLENWKANYGKELARWFDIIGEFEAISSLSNIAFENEDWCFPEVKDKGAIFKAANLGHPLLGDKRVRNNFDMESEGSVVLITGSNMSGKTTFLRTIGINLVLSYTGAPACAENMSTIFMDLYTCMRISDNLEKSISSFYAEILRIKDIVSAAKKENGNTIFFLLDEIFKGTNSIDRHQGATVLIKQLSGLKANGLVSTHDLELADLENTMGKLKNYHFQEYYDKDELKFDYKLRKGVSTTRNAMHIIKLAGIEI